MIQRYKSFLPTTHVLPILVESHVHVSLVGESDYGISGRSVLAIVSNLNSFFVLERNTIRTLIS